MTIAVIDTEMGCKKLTLFIGVGGNSRERVDAILLSSGVIGSRRDDVSFNTGSRSLRKQQTCMLGETTDTSQGSCLGSLGCAGAFLLCKSPMQTTKAVDSSGNHRKGFCQIHFCLEKNASFSAQWT